MSVCWCRLLGARCLLAVACYLLVVVGCDVCLCLFVVVCRLLYGVYCLLNAVRCGSCAGFCLLSRVCCVLFGV